MVEKHKEPSVQFEFCIAQFVYISLDLQFNENLLFLASVYNSLFFS